jgi:PAS domain S-box-containing protein
MHIVIALAILTMCKSNTRQEAKPQTLEANSPILIDSAALGKKDSLHILQVDDDVCLLEVSKQILLMENSFEIESVTSVDEAFKKLEKQTFDAIVSDYEMPLKNGLEFLKELRAQGMDIPFILFTGKGREDVAVRALNLGADSYLNKNGSPETVYCELADAINKTVERKKSRKLLAKSEAKYRTLVENSLQGISILQTAPLRLVFANDAMVKILGYSSQELMALSPEGIMSLVHHEDRAAFFRRMENRLRGEPPGACYEFRGVRKDGSIIWLSALANRVEYEGQLAVQGMFLDIDESKKTEGILRESEARYRELANSLPEIVFETDLNGQLVFANERAAEISGYSHGELEKGLNIMQFLVPEDREKAMKNIQRSLSGDIYAPVEYTVVRKNGTTFPALITATPCICKNKVTGLRGLVLDISERKKADLALVESEGRLRTIFEGASDGILVADSKTKRFVFANPRICEITGYSLKELLQLNVSDIHSEKDLPYLIDQFTKQAQGEITLVTNVPVLRKDEKVVYCDINSKPAKIGKQEYVVGFFRDITERKKAEEVLQESVESFSCLIDSMDDLVFVLGFDGIFKNYHQPSHKKELYAPPEDFIGKHFLDVLPPQVAELIQAAMKKIEDSGETQEFDYYLEMNGEKSWYNARLSPTKDKAGRKTPVTVVVRNITERKKTEESLEEERQELNSIIDSSPIIIFYKDKEGKFIRVNEAFAEAQGIPKDEFFGKTVFDFYSAEIARGMANDDLEVLKSGYPRLGIIEQYESASGMRWVQTDKVPTFDKNGISTGLVGFAQDLTERMKAEEALNVVMGQLVLVNEKLGVVGSLTRHDVGNKLMAAKSNLYLLKKRIGDNPDLAKYLDGIDCALASSSEIFEFSRLYERIGVEKASKENVFECFNQAVLLMPNLGNVKIMNECHGLVVVADSLLRQLFYNFIDNSLKHGQKVTQIRLYYIENGDGVRLFYEDNGIGVSEANKPKLFESGFTTGKGSGFGLYLIKKMMDVYGWTITETGEPGKGAKFTITTPKLNKNGKENYQIT